MNRIVSNRIVSMNHTIRMIHRHRDLKWIFLLKFVILFDLNKLLYFFNTKLLGNLIESNKIANLWVFFFSLPSILITQWVFWVNIAKREVNLRYRYCLKLFRILRREIEFRQRWYQISSAQFCCPCAECQKWKGKKNKNKNWQTNCGNAIAEIGV